MPSNDAGLLYWTEVLSGIGQGRVRTARATLESWGYRHLSDELLAPSVDAAVAATLLVEGIDRLAEHGVPRERTLKKIRQDREVWGTWAEIRAADTLLRTLFPDAQLRLEQGKSKGAHADFRFLLAEPDVDASVEVKAVGLSDEEVAFCERMTSSLRRMLPRVGLAHGHAPIDAKPPRLTREHLRAGARVAKRAVRDVPRYPQGLRGAVLVGHGSERSYAQRVGRRVAQAVRQLPEGDECWVAIYWSNGAPAETVRHAVRWTEIPTRVVGLILVGCGIAFPDRQIHCYTMVIPRDSEPGGERPLYSMVGEDALANLILQRFERSSGVRATLLVGGARTLIVREGKRRILPFNLLMDVDPPDFDRSAHGRPWRSP